MTLILSYSNSHSIKSEAINTKIHPIDQYIIHLLLNQSIGIVQVRLLRSELVEVELASLLNIGPSRETENADLNTKAVH